MRTCKKYQIEKMTEEDKVLYVVYAIDINSPSEFIINIENELKKKKGAGEVVFDLIIPNGGKRNRYVHSWFNGEKLNNYILESVDSIEKYKKLSKISSSFFKKNYEKVNTRLLSSATSFALKQGIPI